MSGASCELTPKVKVTNSQGTDTYQDSELYRGYKERLYRNIQSLFFLYLYVNYLYICIYKNKTRTKTNKTR